MGVDWAAREADMASMMADGSIGTVLADVRRCRKEGCVVVLSSPIGGGMTATVPYWTGTWAGMASLFRQVLLPVSVADSPGRDGIASWRDHATGAQLSAAGVAEGVVGGRLAFGDLADAYNSAFSAGCTPPSSIDAWGTPRSVLGAWFARGGAARREAWAGPAVAEAFGGMVPAFGPDAMAGVFGLDDDAFAAVAEAMLGSVA